MELVVRADEIATPQGAFFSKAALVQLRTSAASEVVRIFEDAAPRFPCNAL